MNEVNNENNIQDPSNEVPVTEIMVKGRIADRNGDSEFLGTLNQAVDVIIENTRKLGKWVLVDTKEENGEVATRPFLFLTYAADEIQKLKDALMSVTEPRFVVTPALVGGASNRKRSSKKKVTKRVTKKKMVIKKKAVNFPKPTGITPLINGVAFRLTVERKQFSIIQPKVVPFLQISTLAKDKSNKSIPTINVIASNYNGLIGKMRPHREAIISSIIEVLDGPLGKKPIPVDECRESNDVPDDLNEAGSVTSVSVDPEDPWI